MNDGLDCFVQSSKFARNSPWPVYEKGINLFVNIKIKINVRLRTLYL